MPVSDVGYSKILKVLKDKIKLTMEGFRDTGNTYFVFKTRLKMIYTENQLSVPWSRYPSAFIVVTRTREDYHSIQRKRRWVVSLQIEFYFADYTPIHEGEALEFIEEVSRMVRENPILGQPAPNDFKILDWVSTGSDIEYFTQDNHTLMGVVCTTDITLLDCRGQGGP